MNKTDDMAYIFVVDDEEDIRELLQYNLIQDGHRVSTFENGSLCLKAVEDEKPDLILLDVMMPVLDGMSTLKALRQWPNSPLTNMLVIMVTAHAMTGDRERFLAAGANGYVSKPIGFEALEQEIQRLARAKTQPPSI